MSDFSGTPAPIVQNAKAQQQRLLLGAGAVGLVLLLAVMARSARSAAPQQRAESEDDRTLFVPTQSETTIINYQSNNTTRSDGMATIQPYPNTKNPGPYYENRLGIPSPLLRARSGGTVEPKPMSGGWQTTDTLDQVRPLTGLSFAPTPRKLQPDLPNVTEATVRVAYAQAYGDQPDQATLDMLESEYQNNRDRFPGLAQFSQFLQKWTSNA